MCNICSESALDETHLLLARDRVALHRLRLYRPADAVYAIQSGHLDKPWGAGATAATAQHVPAQLMNLLRADRLVV